MIIICRINKSHLKSFGSLKTSNVSKFVPFGTNSEPHNILLISSSVRKMIII